MKNDEKIFVTRPSLPPFDEYVNEIKKIWVNKTLTNNGELHNELERQLRNYLNVDNLILTSNGHNALELALQSLNLRGEVITTPFTFVSTTHAIMRNGLKPVFCDIKDCDYTIDENKIENLITKDTCAIVPVHVYGNVCNVEVIEKIAKKYSLKVIYDSAHTFGEMYCGKSVCSFGDASIISFHATKAFNTVEGGAICTHSSELFQIISQLKNFGIQDAECVNYIGTNAKMSEFHAAMGLCNLRHFKDERSKRKRIVEKYLEMLQGIKGIILPDYRKEIEYNYAYFPILFEERIYGFSRNDVYRWLSEKNIFARKYFYPLTSTLCCYKEENALLKTPIAAEIANKILCLPLYADMDINDATYICEVIRSKNDRIIGTN